MAAPVQKKTIVKKKTKKFTRFQAHMYQRIGGTKKLAAWRKPRGIDCSARRGFRGEIRHPKIGYGSNKKTAHMVPNGFLKFLVTCPMDIDMLLMHNGKYAAELAGNLSAKTRREVVKRADQMNVCVLNRNSRLTTEESD